MRRKETSTEPLEEKELAYLAGFFDGEGSIGLYHSGPHRGLNRLEIKVCSVTRASIEQFARSFGGRVADVRANSTSRLGKRAVYGWAISGSQAQVALALLLPHLREKRPQAVEALRYRIGHKGRVLSDAEKTERQEIATNLRLLKREVA